MVFADSSFFVALQLLRDRHHDDATALWRADDGRIATTNHVVGETWTGLRRRAGHAAACRYYRAVTSEPRIAVISVSPELERIAWRWLIQHDEREYSFVDATSFAVMRDTRMIEALAFDGDFSAAGFIEKRP